jgi:DNA-binding CsgD family transcriptional regulator
MELVERDPAIETLSAGLASAVGGQGRTMLVTGEAGVGKSALVSAFAARERDRADLMWGACDALFTPRPLGPLRDIALQAQGKLLEALDADRDRHHLFTLFLGTLQRRERPVIVVFEDVHWADDATLDLIKFVGRRIANAGALVVLTYRDDELDPRHRLLSVVGELPRGSTIRVALEPLSETSVGALARKAARATDARQLFAATGGNPFYVTEVLAAQGAGVPPTVRDAVLARAGRLSGGAREALDIVSLSPGGIEPWLIDACTRSAGPALDECVANGMLRVLRGHYAFRHELARLAVVGALAPARRRDFSRSVLAALRTREITPDRLARVAHHAEAAEDHAAVLEYAPAAARHAASVGAYREAFSHLATAQRYADELPLRERAVLLEQFAAQAWLIGEHTKALEAYSRVCDLWRTLDEPVLEAHARTKMSGPFTGLTLDHQADDTVRAAIDLLERLPPGPVLAEAYARRCTCQMLLRNHAAAMAWGEKALELATRTDATEAAIIAHNGMGAALIVAGDKARGREQLERSLALGLAGGFPRYVALAYGNLVYALAEVHDFASAASYLAPGIAYTTEREMGFVHSLMRACMAVAQLHLGQWDAAAETAQSVLRSPDVVALTGAVALRALGRLRVRRGDPDAMSALDEALALTLPSRNMQRIAPVRAARAEAAWVAGDAAATSSEAGAEYAAALESRHPWFVGELAYWQWKAGALDAAPSFAAEPFRLQIEGKPREAAAAWDTLGCAYEAARALAEADDEARLRALERFDALGARPAADRLRQQLRERGMRSIPRGPRAATRANAFNLTARELEVVALLAEGLTNTTIATRLYRSARTVDNHVASIFAKLSVSTREAAVAAAASHGLIQKIGTGPQQIR